MDRVNECMVELSKEVSIFASNVKSIRFVNESLISWNKSFGRMQLALDILKPPASKRPRARTFSSESTNTKPEETVAPPQEEEQQEEARQQHQDEEDTQKQAEISTSKGKKRKNGNDASSSGVAKMTKRAKVSAWEQTIKDIKRDLPKKYQSTKEDLDRLRTVWENVESKPNGAVLSDIVKLCGCSVLQANECLAVLIKFKLITKKKERTVVRYVAIR